MVEVARACCPQAKSSQGEVGETHIQIHKYSKQVRYMLPLILIDFVIVLTLLTNNVKLYNTATEQLIQKLHCQLRVGLVSPETDRMLLFCPLCLEIMTYSIRSLRVWF